MSDVFKTDGDAPFLKHAGVTSFEDPRYEKHSRRLARLRGIKKYVYRMDILERSLSYDEVTEIFVRVNSLGAKLRSSDLALAQITAAWRNSLALFEGFQRECAKLGFDIELGVHLRNLVVFATGQSRFRSVANLRLAALQDAFERSSEGMRFAVNFMKANLGIDSPALLSSPLILIALASYGARRDFEIGNEEADLLRYWALIANAKGRYSRGSSETILDQDLTILRQGGGGADLIDRLRLQVGRLDIAPDELEGRNQRSALFKTMFLAFREAGAKDWKSNLAISLSLTASRTWFDFAGLDRLCTAWTSRQSADEGGVEAFAQGRDRLRDVAFGADRERHGVCYFREAEMFRASGGYAVLRGESSPFRR